MLVLIVALIALAVIAIGAETASASAGVPGGTPDLSGGLGGSMPVDLNSKSGELARAIAQAEGFYAPNSLPAPANNPGDLELGDIGFGTINEKTVFPSLDAGWQALEDQADRMLTGSSSIYQAHMTLNQVARLYTGEDNASGWAQTVANHLGLSVGNTLSDFLGM